MLHGLTPPPTRAAVFSRLMVLWGISNVSPPSQMHWSFSLMAASWAAVEVPRYLYYVLHEHGALPGWLKWLRYSLFIFLYPTGITGEVGQLLTSLSYIRDHGVGHYSLPNAHNLAFNYYYVLFGLLATYVPGSYIMYSHMLRQRASQLSGKAAKKD
jgi:very-long-chain (3R)-3-hydroxyacyl-CoA dehydratase